MGFNYQLAIKRAFVHAFNVKKIIFAYPFVFLCGLIVVFSKLLALAANRWIMLSLFFLPILFSVAILYVLGIFLNQIYYKELKNAKVSYFDIMKNSFDKVLASLNISISFVLVFLIIWLIFGLLVAIKQIPHLGMFIAGILSFLPFLLIFGTILLCIVDILVLFFAAPIITFNEKKKFTLIKKIFFENFQKNVFESIFQFFIGTAFIFFALFYVYVSAKLTSFLFYIPIKEYLALKEFFVTILASLFLTPFVIFFFNFSLESYNFFQKRYQS